MNKARIIGTGCYLPERVLSNQDLEKMVETTDEWISTRTGMKERRIAKEDEYTSEMGAKAALSALEDAGVAAEDVDLILFATLTPDYLFPSTACLVQSEIKAVNAAAVDIQAACSGYLYGLSQAMAYVNAGIYKNVLLVASEKLSSIVDYKDRNTCVLFGDGASACLISNQGKGLLIDDVSLGADGSLAPLLILPGGGARNPPTEKTLAEGLHYLKMEGKEVFKHAVRRMEMAAKQCLTKTGLASDQISWIVPHQANMRIIEAIAKRFETPMEKVYMTIHKYGNTSASSVGIALHELLKEGKVSKGDHLLLVAFGAGLTWGASILTMMEGDRL